LAPAAPEDCRARALAILVKGIEVHRENAPDGRVLSGTVQASRRAVKKAMKAITKAGVPQFNSFARIGGRPCGLADDGLYWLDDEGSGEDLGSAFDGLEKPIANALRTDSEINQLRAGFGRVDSRRPLSTYRDGGRTVADLVLEGIANPRDWDAELAGYIYLAITRGLLIKASMGWYDTKPVRTGSGWNYGRLLELVALQTGLTLPSSRAGMEGLMVRGRGSAERMLEPAITYPDGRTFSYFDIEFPEG